MATTPGAMNNDTVIGDDGSDTLGSGGFEETLLDGAGGDDTLVADSNDNTMLGGTGNDDLQSTGDDNLISGGSGDDYVATGDGANGNLAHAGIGGDTLAGGSGADRFVGASGNDSLDGGAGNDLLVGGSDDDILIGGAGDDRLIGGEGNDVFFFQGAFGNDTINDLDVGDQIHIQAGNYDGVAVGSVADVAAHVTAWTSGDQTLGSVITLGGNTIKIANLDPTELDADSIANYIKVV